MRIRRKSNECYNCGFTLDSVYNYCPNCGQENNNNNVSFGKLIKEFFGNYFSLDSRLSKSFKPFFFKPGHLTNQFNLGKRMSFVNPVRLYLVVSLFYFFVFSMVGKKSVQESEDGGNSQGIVVTTENLDRVDGMPDSIRRKINRSFADKSKERINESFENKTMDEFYEALTMEEKEELKEILTEDGWNYIVNRADSLIHLRDSLIAVGFIDTTTVADQELEIDSVSIAQDTTATVDSTFAETPTTATSSDDGSDNKEDDGFILNRVDFDLLEDLAKDDDLTDQQIYDSLDVGEVSYFDEKVVRQSIRIQRADREVVVSYILKNLPLMMFLLIPIFASILKLLYIRRKVLYIRHLIHGIHLHSFAYIVYGVAFLIMMPLDDDISSIIGVLSFILVSTYAYISFLRVYKQGWFKSLVKFNVVGVLYLSILFVFFIAEMLLSILLF